MSERVEQFGPLSIIRGVARQWWRILLLSVLVSIPLMFGIFHLVEPSFEAFSLLEVEPTSPQLFGPLHGSPDLAEPYLLTQLKLITSNTVLDEAISSDSRIKNLPMIKESKDPKAELRKSLVVEIPDRNTYLIRVALASNDPKEAADIVNAVVAAYLAQHGQYHRKANNSLNAMLTNELRKLDGEIETKKTELTSIVSGGDVELDRPMIKMDASKKDDPGTDPSLSDVTREQFTKLSDRLIQADLELIDAEARLESAKLAGIPGGERLRDLEIAVGEARRKRKGYARYIESVKVIKKAVTIVTFKVEILKQELDSRRKMRDIITMKMEQLGFEDKQEQFRVSLHDPAAVPTAQSDNKRSKLMAAAPVLILAMILGWFLLVEIGQYISHPATSPPTPEQSEG